jgi:hypothetical protein
VARRGAFLAACASLACLVVSAGCSKGPAPSDAAFVWPPVESVAGPPDSLAAPSSVALVCPGARNATAWLADGTFWNGDVELAFFDAEGKPLPFRRKDSLDSGVPIYLSQARDSITPLQIVAFSPWRNTTQDTAGWAWILVQYPHPRSQDFRFQVAVRSGGGDGRYIDPRAAHADSFTYRSDGDRALRDGRIVAIFDAGGTHRDLEPSATPEIAPYDRYELRREYVIPAGGKGPTTFRFALAPLGGVDAAARPPGWSQTFAAAFEPTAKSWTAELAKGARYTFPDPQWQRVFTASKGLLVTDYERHGASRSPLGNPLQYRDFYLRDGARVIRALDLLGRHDLAAEGLALLYKFQWPPGAFVSQRGQLDGTGQAIWALTQHVALAGGDDALRAYGEAALKGAAWVVRNRQSTTEIGGPAAGLMPYSDPRDNEMIRGHLLGTDAWSVFALENTAVLSERMGRDPTAWRNEAAAYRKHLLEVWDREARRQGRPMPPAVERGARDWGNLSAVYPTAVLDASDARVRALDAWLHATYVEGLMTFGSRDSLHHYVTFDVTQARLRRGDRAGTLVDIQALLDHTLPDGTGWELRHRTGAGYGDNLPPHGTFAAMWIDLARSCVLYERGDSLVVLAGVPESWLTAGGLAVENAPTAFGLAAVKTSANGEIALDLPAPARVVLPAGFRADPVGGAAGTFGGGSIRVPKGKSTWRVTRSDAG